MKIHHLRNATLIIETDASSILVDPMLGSKSSLPPFARFKHKPLRNPLVELPPNTHELLEKVSFCLITHSQKLGLKSLTHTDHLDDGGVKFLKKQNLQVVTRRQDSQFLAGQGLNVGLSLDYWQPQQFSGWTITAVPARHGHGVIRHFMANGAGYYLEHLEQPSVYISGDTVFTDQIKRALLELQPDIAVVAAGCASLDIGGPILMTMEEIVRFIETAPGKVIANHLEALNHCSISREELKRVVNEKMLSYKVVIPKDGETVVIN